MSAEILRRAASLMRERVEAATEGPWWNDRPLGNVIFSGTGLSDDVAVTEDFDKRADAEHIASWHPAVALAVADWLDAVATRIEEIHESLPFSARLTLNSLNVTAVDEALAVARAYLGESA